MLISRLDYQNWVLSMETAKKIRDLKNRSKLKFDEEFARQDSYIFCLEIINNFVQRLFHRPKDLSRN